MNSIHVTKDRCQNEIPNNRGEYEVEVESLILRKVQIALCVHWLRGAEKDKIRQREGHR